MSYSKRVWWCYKIKWWCYNTITSRTPNFKKNTTFTRNDHVILSLSLYFSRFLPLPQSTRWGQYGQHQRHQRQSARHGDWRRRCVCDRPGRLIHRGRHDVVCLQERQGPLAVGEGGQRRGQLFVHERRRQIAVIAIGPPFRPA